MSFQAADLNLAGQVLKDYPQIAHNPDVEYLGSAGGFSGARLWKIKSDSDSKLLKEDCDYLCLRQWPAGFPTIDHLKFIHRVLSIAQSRGVDFVPAPFSNRHGKTISFCSGSFWELSPWISGEASYWKEPNREKLASAMKALAKFHLAVRTDENRTCSKGMQDRLNRLTHFENIGIARISNHLDDRFGAELLQIAQKLVAGFELAKSRIKNEIRDVVQLKTSVQPVIRDIWHDHVLYEGDQVTGIIDFGAMNLDTVACDISRLVGSLVGDDRESWNFAISSYESNSQLSMVEKKLIACFDRNSTLMSGLNWLEWLFIDKRQFDSVDTILARMRRILGRLGYLLENDRRDG